MSDVLTLDLVDKDGAIREALDEANRGTREELFRKAIIGGGAFLAGGLLHRRPAAPRRRPGALGRAGRRDPQLRAHARVPRVRVLRRRRRTRARSAARR